ncbi:MAG: hypothetical protein QW343_00930 [Candidatus Norongarragalinales archaeon]
MFHQRRAFIFTIDAVLALALASSLLVLCAFVFLTPARNEKFFELEQLGFDSLALEHNETSPLVLSDENFFVLTGLRRFRSASEVEAAGVALVAHARFYHYPRLCGCPPRCVVPRSDYCLNSSDAALGVFGANYSEVWVTS